MIDAVGLFYFACDMRFQKSRVRLQKAIVQYETPSDQKDDHE